MSGWLLRTCDKANSSQTLKCDPLESHELNLLVIWNTPDTGVNEVIRIFREFGFRHTPVVKDGRAVGIISDRDILLARPMGVSEVLRAKEVMTKSPYSASIDASLEEIALELSNRKFSSVLVDEFYGIFTATDALNALVEILRSKGGNLQWRE